MTRCEHCGTDNVINGRCWWCGHYAIIVRTHILVQAAPWSKAQVQEYQKVNSDTRFIDKEK